MTEIWHPCAGFETHYEVSSLGRVRSIARHVPHHKGGFRLSPARVLRQAISGSGYALVSFCVDGVKSNQSVHRLVARAFISNEANKPQVNHKNGVKTDNFVSNLEWVTASENGLHSYRTLGNVSHGGQGFGAEHSNVKPVLATNVDSGKAVLLLGTRQKKEMGFGQTCVDKAIRENKCYRGWTFARVTKAEVDSLKAQLEAN